MCVRSDVLDNKLEWPQPHPEPCRNIDAILGERPTLSQVDASPSAPSPPHPTNTPHPPTHPTPQVKQSVPKRVTEKSNMERIIKLLQDKGVDPFKSTYIVEIGQSSSHRGTIMQECSPCLTKTRCSQGGHWVTTHGRKLCTSEMLALQNMTPDRV